MLNFYQNTRPQNPYYNKAKQYASGNPLDVVKRYQFELIGNIWKKNRFLADAVNDLVCQYIARGQLRVPAAHEAYQFISNLINAAKQELVEATKAEAGPGAMLQDPIEQVELYNSYISQRFR